MIDFINYAHRGASEYMPENTLLSFYNGIAMGANGIETDVRRVSDGTLILFHDDTLDRVTDGTGNVEEYSYPELLKFNVKKNEFYDKIVTFEEFLQKFAFRDLTFAIELKGAGVEEETAELLRRHEMQEKTVVTSFKLDYIKKFKEYAPEFSVGYLAKKIDDELIYELRKIGVQELCPRAKIITPELVKKWHSDGFNVRAWGVDSEETMKKVYDSGVDGMTVNFPDKLTEYINNKK